MTETDLTPDYRRLIDQATWDFIERTGEFYPENTVSLSLAEQRAIYDRMCKEFNAGHPANVKTQDQAIHEVPVRLYDCPNAQGTVIYMHGGGFVVGGLESHDDVCAEICAGVGIRVVSIDYRLAPEHPHPAAFDDCLKVTKAVLAENGPIILVGDSAGAALAASVSHALRAGPVHSLGQVLIYPGLGGNRNTGSYLAHARAPMLTRDDVLFYASIRYNGPEPVADPTAAALQDNDFTNLPTTIVFSAECDPLCDDGAAYCAAITTAGGKATWVCEQGLVHGYLRARHTVPRAAASFARIIAAIRKLRDGDD